ncbi:hypothetical protein ACIPLC_00750 [Kitasatospora sp. NPDC086801]|uniref:hypothetical protein n=1 Tax=Kitasatospora sp. NPDC086801 TaxID=3364066 RepID=UPI0038149BE8
MPNPLDDSTLAEIARLICGDDGPVIYRKGWELPQFFTRAGWAQVPDHDGSPRVEWTLERLRERQQDSEDIERAVLRVVNPVEFHGQEKEFKATLHRLNDILALEGLRVEYVKGRPQLIEQDPVFDPGVRIPRVELKVSITEVVKDPELARAVQMRLDEARACAEQGFYISALIMMGSLLEGVLLHAAEVRTATTPLPKPLRNMGLQDLVDFAHDNGWIQHDAKMASQLVRHYRNLVHPHLERRTRHTPDGDTVDMCWPVVPAILNDLAASA